MADPAEPSPGILLDQLTRLDPQERHELTAVVRQLAHTFGEVSNGKNTAYALGVLAQLLAPT